MRMRTDLHGLNRLLMDRKGIGMVSLLISGSRRMDIQHKIGKNRKTSGAQILCWTL